MNTKTCPMCQGEDFFTSTHMGYTDGIVLAAFNRVAVFASVCLSCGFVAPTVEDAGLATIREMARKRANEIGKKPNARELGEL